jgi:hypothetical protein
MTIRKMILLAGVLGGLSACGVNVTPPDAAAVVRNQQTDVAFASCRDGNQGACDAFSALARAQTQKAAMQAQQNANARMMMGMALMNAGQQWQANWNNTAAAFAARPSPIRMPMSCSTSFTGQFAQTNCY